MRYRRNGYLLFGLRSCCWIIMFLMFSAGMTAVPLQESPSPDSIAISSDSLTLDRVIVDVLKRNDRAIAARYMQEAAERQVAAAGAWDDPMLMFGVQNLPVSFDFQMDNMTMRMVGISQNIPYAGQKGLARRSAKAEAAAAGEERYGIEIDLITAAKQAYYDLYYRELNLRHLREQHDLLNQVVALNMARLKTNQVGQGEVLTAQADLWRLESSILSLEQQVEAAKKDLNVLRGDDPSESVPLLARPFLAPLPPTARVWLEAAQKNYPPLQQLRRKAESYAFSAASVRRMQWPMLSLSASYGFRSGTAMESEGMLVKRDDMVSFQANLSLPIFAGRQQHQMGRSMEAMQSGSLAEANQLWREMQADLLTLFERVQRLQQSLELYQGRIVPASEDAYQSALNGYTNNKTSFASLLALAVNLNRDRITADELANEIARTLTEAERYTTDMTTWDALTNGGINK